MKLSIQHKVFLLAVVFSMLASTMGLYGYQLLYTPNVLGEGDTPRYLYVHENEPFSSVVKSLQAGDYLSSLQSFAFVAKILGADKRIKAGYYALPPDMGNLALLRLLQSGKQAPVRVRFHGIRSVETIAQAVANQLAFNANDLLTLICSDSVVAAYGFTRATFPLMFIPNTYELYWTISPTDFLNRMHREYVVFWDSTRQQQATAQGLTPIEAGVLASIVQAETRQKAEQPRVAGVYLNRLRQRIPLSADPTLVFAWQDFSIRRVLNRHKKIDSPYNTYARRGLPPGPINVPEIHSVEAVLKAESHRYLYFCAAADFSGNHVFTTNLKSHLQQAAKYHKALNKARIYK